MVAVHSTARGPGLGGCRMWTYDDSRSAVRDVLRLSRAMTFKAAVAGLPLGGGKGVIMLRPDEAVLTPERRQAVLQDFGETVDALGGSYLTAEDVGTSERDMEVIARRTKHVTGLATGSGDPSPWTALGCEVALRVTCERVVRHRRPRRPQRRGDRARQRRRPAGRDAGRGRRAARRRRRRPVQARAGGPAGRRVDRPAVGHDRRGRRRRAVRAGRRAQRRDRARAALPRDRRRRQQPARRRRARRRRWPSAGSCGRPTSSATPAGSSTSASSSSPRATRPSAPTPACAPSATRCARSSTPRPRAGRRRCRPRTRSAASG